MNKRSKPITEDTSPMEAENQDMPFVNTTLDDAKGKNLIKNSSKKGSDPL